MRQPVALPFCEPLVTALLKELGFQEFAEGSPRFWRLETLSLQRINLLVGQNASGKTRTINVISALASLFRGLTTPAFESGTYDAKFDLNGETWRYQLEVADFKVTSEILSQGRRHYLSRSAGGFGTIYAHQLKRRIRFQTPETQLAVVARQDIVQHPFLEPFIEWGNAVLLFKFGGDLGRQSMVARMLGQTAPLDTKNTDLVIPIYIDGSRQYGDAFDQAILGDMGAIGYQLTEIGVRVANSIQINGLKNTQFENMYVSERDTDITVDQFVMSAGMFRALSVIVQINYSIFSKKPICVLIDDIGEGLDFDRSSALISLLLKKIESSNDQIIMTTNDRFTMNAVPLEFWSIISRAGHEVRVYNKSNAKTAFESFSLTGLSNFDFFSTEYAIANSEVA